MTGLYSLDTSCLGSTVYRNPQALSSALATLGSLQPRAFRFLYTVNPLLSVSNYYIATITVRVLSSNSTPTSTKLTVANWTYDIETAFVVNALRCGVYIKGFSLIYIPSFWTTGYMRFIHLPTDQSHCMLYSN